MKKDVVELIKTNKVNELKKLDTNIPAEKYLLSTYNILKTISKIKTEEFFREYQTLILHKKIPLLNYETITKLYKVWLHNPNICNDLIYLANQINFYVKDESVWNIIINKSLNFGLAKNELSHRYFLISKLFNEHVILKEDTHLIQNVLKALLNKPFSKDDLSISKKQLYAKYKLFFLWAKAIADEYRLKDYEKLNIEHNNMYEKHFNLKTFNGVDNNDFLDFIAFLNKTISISYVNKYMIEQLKQLFDLYKVKPSLFEKGVSEGDKFQGDDILKYCFKDYKVSGVFINRFFDLKSDEKKWLYQTLKGKNLIYAKNTPLPMTKKAVHIFRGLNQNTRFNVKEALVYASILSNDVDEQYAREVVNSIKNFSESKFWVITMVSFYKKGLTLENVSTSMDYIYDKAFTREIEVKWKAKNVANLLKESQDWHYEIANRLEFQRVRVKKSVFKVSRIPYFKLEVDNVLYSIKQIQNSEELYLEGKNLNHCVYSYNRFCKDNICEIFSLRKENNKSLITIEVRNGKVVQARGAYNRPLETFERSIISKWADESAIKF